MRVLAAVLVSMTLAGSVWAADTKELYEKKCNLCHSIGGVGGKKMDVGGPLDGVGSKRDAAWLKEYLKDPKSKVENAKMPKMPLSDEDLDGMVAYMSSLKK